MTSTDAALEKPTRKDMDVMPCRGDDVNCATDVTVSHMVGFEDFNRGFYYNNATWSDSQSYQISGYVRIPYFCAFVVISIATVCGNSVLIAVVATQRRMRTVVNYFLVNVAVAEISYIIFCSLFTFIYILKSNWYFGNGYCRFMIFFSVCTWSVKVLTMVAAAFDRFNMTFNPQRKMGVAATVAVIASTWILSMIVAFPYWLYTTTNSYNRDQIVQTTFCEVLWPEKLDFRLANTYTSFVLYVIPVAMLFFTYLMIAKQLRLRYRVLDSKQPTTGHEETNSSQSKAVLMLAVMCVIYAICLLPGQVLHLIYIFQGILVEIKFYDVAHLLAMSDGMFDPIVFWWSMRNRSEVCCRFDGSSSKSRTSKETDDIRCRDAAESMAMVNV